MTVNSLDTEKLKHTRVDSIEIGSQEVGGCHRELFFSRWCDKEGTIPVDTPLIYADTSAQHTGFKLPSLQLGQLV